MDVNYGASTGVDYLGELSNSTWNQIVGLIRDLGTPFDSGSENSGANCPDEQRE